jgi:hypothetical protein
MSTTLVVALAMGRAATGRQRAAIPVSVAAIAAIGVYLARL